MKFVCNSAVLYQYPFTFTIMFVIYTQVRASSYNSNKLTNKMQQFYKFIT